MLEFSSAVLPTLYLYRPVAAVF